MVVLIWDVGDLSAHSVMCVLWKFSKRQRSRERFAPWNQVHASGAHTKPFFLTQRFGGAWTNLVSWKVAWAKVDFRPSNPSVTV